MALFFIVCSAMTTSCTEEIDIPLDNTYTRLVVEGAITTDTTTHMIHLTTTSSYYSAELPPPVRNARVTLSDGVDTILLQEAYEGVYMTSSEVFGVIGRTYTLKIQLQQPIGGHSEYTASSKIYEVNELDSISLDFHSDWGSEGVWEVKCHVQEPPTVDYYRFMIYRNNVLHNPNVQYWFVIDDRFFNGNYAAGAPVAYFRQDNEFEQLYPGDTVGVEVNRISKEFYEYILEVQSAVQGSYPLFSGPPANVKGNISNGAVGFFAAYDRTLKSKRTPEAR